MNVQDIRRKVRELMPGAVEDVKRLVRIPSVAFPGFPPAPVMEMAEATVGLLKRSGVENARLLDVPGGYPAVYAEIPAPPGAPSVLLYAHYDVQPAGKDQGWQGDPWDPAVRDGRLYGRGTADDKSGILVHAASLQVFGGRPPIGVRVVIEGEEETTSHLHEFIRDHPDLFQCDLIIVCDLGSLAAGEPALNTALRGEVSCLVTVRTLAHAVHSGTFGGPAPDALVALIRMMAALHQDDGNVAIPGLAAYPWEGQDFPVERFREVAGVQEGVDLIGTGSISTRLWSKPSVTVIGIDAPPTREAVNILIPEATARVSMRIAPGADPEQELQKLREFLQAQVPWHAGVEVTRVRASAGFVCPKGGRGYALARRAMEAAYGTPVQEIGSGGSIPLLQVLAAAVPGAEFVLWGCEDMEHSRTHGPEESVDLGELERMVLTQTLLVQALGDEWMMGESS